MSSEFFLKQDFENDDDFDMGGDIEISDESSDHVVNVESAPIIQIDVVPKSQMRSLNELGGVRSLQSVVYEFHRRGLTPDFIHSVAKVMEDYMDEVGKTANTASLERVAQGLERLVAEGVTKEEAVLLYEDSNMVEHSVFQKLQILVSEMSIATAVFDLATYEVIFTTEIAINGFLSAICPKNGIADVDAFPADTMEMLFNMTKNVVKNTARTLFARLVNSPIPLNFFILEGEMTKVVQEVHAKASKQTTNDPGLLSSVAFPTKVVTAAPHHNMLYMSPQIIDAFKEEFVGDVMPIMQVTQGMSVPVSHLDFDGGNHIIIPASYSESANMSDDIDSEVERARVNLATKTISVGMTSVTVGEKKYRAILTKWSGKLTEDEVRGAKTIGYVDKSMYDKYQSQIKKGKMTDGYDPRHVAGALIWILVDPISRRILIIPKKFLKKNSYLLDSKNPVHFGMRMTYGFSSIMNHLCSAFFLGLLTAVDWQNLQREEFENSYKPLKKLVNMWSKEHYGEFLDIMIPTYNTYHKLATFHPSTKGIVDREVMNFLSQEEYNKSYEDLEPRDKDDGFDPGDFTM